MTSTSDSRDSKPPRTALFSLRDIADELCAAVEMYNQENKEKNYVVPLKRDEAVEYVYQVVDNIFRSRLLWSDRECRMDAINEQYFPKHPRSFFDTVLDEMEIGILNMLKAHNLLHGDTWDLIVVSRLGSTNILITNSGDYRIWDWMRMHTTNITTESASQVVTRDRLRLGKRTKYPIPEVKAIMPVGHVYDKLIVNKIGRAHV